MRRILFTYPYGGRMGFIQLELTDYVGNDNILKPIEDVRREYQNYMGEDLSISAWRRLQIRVRMKVDNNQNSNIVIRLDSFVEGGIDNPMYNIVEPDRIDPSTQPSTRDLAYFIETHPNDNYYTLTVDPKLFLYQFWKVPKPPRTWCKVMHEPYTITEFNRELNLILPELPQDYGHKIIKRNGKHTLVLKSGSREYINEVVQYSREKKTIEGLIRVKEDRIKERVFVDQFFYPLLGYSFCVGRKGEYEKFVYHPSTLMAKGVYHAIFVHNRGYFDKSMLKSHQTLAIKRCPTFEFKNVKYTKISKEEYELFQYAINFKGKLVYLTRTIFPIIKEIEIEFQDELPKNIKLHQYVFLMMAYFIGNSKSFAYFQQFLTYLRPVDLGEEFFPKGLPVSTRSLEKYHREIPVEIIKYLFMKITQKLAKDKVINTGVLVGDGTFIHSYASDYKNERTGEYNDKTAGFTVHSEKLLGHGYYTTIYSAYHKDRLIPIYAEVYPGNIHESKVFTATFPRLWKFCRENKINAKVLVYDGAAYSKTNFNLGTAFGIELICPKGERGNQDNVFQATRFSKYDGNDMPDGYSKTMITKLLHCRSHAEAINHQIKEYYNLNRANSHDIVGVTKELFLALFIINCKNYCAAKFNRHDLFNSYSAFSEGNQINS